jgi:TolA-binding protein
LVKSAKIFLAAGATDPARRRLQKVIDDYGGTKAASDAKEMLKKLNE